MKRILLLNGPNLNLLGVREPEIYGHVTLDAIHALCVEEAGDADTEVRLYQSNSEGELVDAIQQARDSADAIVINPAAYSFTSIAILDALKMFEGPVYEVHLSNFHRREAYYDRSLVSYRADGVIAGLGAQGYVLATRHAIDRLR